MANTVQGLLNTSVDDCKISLQHVTDLNLLRELLLKCEEREHKTRAGYVRQRIKQLEGKKARDLAVARFHVEVTRFGLVLDTLGEQARIAGEQIKIAGETLTALHRHQSNLRAVADNALKEVCDAT